MSGEEKAVYHHIVREIVLRIFRELNKGNFEPVLSGFRWGKGVSVRIYCDTRRLDENLAVQLACGAVEAGAAPLGDNDMGR